MEGYCGECQKECTVVEEKEDNGRPGYDYQQWWVPISQCCGATVFKHFEGDDDQTPPEPPNRELYGEVTCDDMAAAAYPW